MSIFDVIKYPVSHPPTLSEIYALPPDIYKKWCKEAGWDTGTIRVGLYHWLNEDNNTYYRRKYFVDMLKKIIREHNESV